MKRLFLYLTLLSFLVSCSTVSAPPNISLDISTDPNENSTSVFVSVPVTIENYRINFLTQPDFNLDVFTPEPFECERRFNGQYVSCVALILPAGSHHIMIKHRGFLEIWSYND